MVQTWRNWFKKHAEYGKTKEKTRSSSSSIFSRAATLVPIVSKHPVLAEDEDIVEQSVLFGPNEREQLEEVVVQLQEFTEESVKANQVLCHLHPKPVGRPYDNAGDGTPIRIPSSLEEKKWRKNHIMTKSQEKQSFIQKVLGDHMILVIVKFQ